MNQLMSILDMQRRYQTTDYREDVVYEGPTCASVLKDEYRSENIDYDRPVFHSPLVSGPDGNVFVLFNMLEECLKNNGYKQEFLEFKNSIENVDYVECINRMALLVDMENVVKKVNVDGEIYKKTIKTPEHVKNPIEFKISTIHQFDEAVKNGFDITTTNTYGRNIMYYIREPELLAHVIAYNSKLKEDGKDYIRYTHLDNFNSPVIIYKENLKSYNLLLRETIKETEELFGKEYMKEILNSMIFGRNVFNNNSIVQFSVNLSRACDSFQEFEKSIDDIAASLALISKADMSYADNMMDLLKSDQVLKNIKENPEKLKKIIDNAVIQYKYNLVEENLSTQEHNHQNHKKMKI